MAGLLGLWAGAAMGQTIYVQKIANSSVGAASAGEVHVIYPVLYKGQRPPMPMWQTVVFGENIANMNYKDYPDTGANPDGDWDVEGFFCRGFVSKAQDSATCNVWGRGDWNTNGSWSNVTLGTDDGQTSGGSAPFTVDSSLHAYATALGAFAYIDVTVPATWGRGEGVIDYQMGAKVSLSPYTQNFQITAQMRPNGGSALDFRNIPLNGRGAVSANYNWDANNQINEVRPWLPDGRVTNAPYTSAPGGNRNLTLELLRNLDPGVYRITITKIVDSTHYATIGRIRVRRVSSALLDPSAANTVDWFKEYARIGSGFQAPGPYSWYYGGNSSYMLAIADSGSTHFFGGGAHGNMNATSASFQVQSTPGGNWTSLGNTVHAGDTLQTDSPNAWHGPYYGVKLVQAAKLDIDSSTNASYFADVDETFLIDQDGMHVTMNFTWTGQSSPFNNVNSGSYVAMYQANTGSYIPKGAYTTLNPYNATHIRFGQLLAADEFAITGAPHSKYDVRARVHKFDLVEGCEQRNVGREFVYTWNNAVNTLPGYSAGTSKHFIGGAGGTKTYVSITNSRNVSAAEVWTVKFDAYYAERNYSEFAPTRDWRREGSIMPRPLGLGLP